MTSPGDDPFEACSRDETSTARCEVCAHLWEHRTTHSSDLRDYYRCFSGKGLDRVLLCKRCGESDPPSSATTVAVSAECCGEFEETGRRLGDWGVPGFPQRDIGLRLSSTRLELPLASGKFTTVAASASHWLGLTSERELLHIDPSTARVRRVCSILDLGLPSDEPLSLVASNRGDFAAVTTNGSLGAVIDLRTGKATMLLNRGDYHNIQCRFSVAFFEHGGRTLLVHATAWNRLDVSDPLTGELLTPRGPTSYGKGEDQPPHYLDYFHCGLSVSPDGARIADNGWVWHPFGVIRTWSLNDWLAGNVWESDDGPSVRTDIGRSYYWDGPLCWVDGQRLAVWGVGEDDRSLLPAVRVVNTLTGEESSPIIGPLGPDRPATSLETALRQTKLADGGVLDFDRHLFAWSPAAGFSVWDINDGARLFSQTDFCPAAYNRTTGDFFTVDSSGGCCVSKLTSESG